MAHVGLLPDMFGDFGAIGVDPAELEPLYASAAGYVRMWRVARAVARDIGTDRGMTATVTPNPVRRDRPQAVTVAAVDRALGEPLRAGEVWIDSRKVADLGVPFTVILPSRLVPEVCTVPDPLPNDPRPPRPECIPAHREADPISVEIRSGRYRPAVVEIVADLPQPVPR